VADARNYDAVNELVERNVGYSMHLKPLVAADLAARRFVPLRLDGSPIFGEIVVAVSSRRRMSPLIEEFIRFMRTELERLQSDRGSTTKPGVSQRRAAGPRRPR
jgi:DNA-binding transcriptional LysR family regulator